MLKKLTVFILFGATILAIANIACITSIHNDIPSFIFNCSLGYFGLKVSLLWGMYFLLLPSSFGRLKLTMFGDNVGYLVLGVSSIFAGILNLISLTSCLSFTPPPSDPPPAPTPAPQLIRQKETDAISDILKQIENSGL